MLDMAFTYNNDSCSILVLTRSLFLDCSAQGLDLWVLEELPSAQGIKYRCRICNYYAATKPNLSQAVAALRQHAAFSDHVKNFQVSWAGGKALSPCHYLSMLHVVAQDIYRQQQSSKVL